MNAENELSFHTKKTMPLPLKSLWLGFWRIVVTGATLACIYYLFAVWGVILLVILAGRQVRAVLRGEAQRRP
jgi:uncharacterized membrane protein YoaK (UPF0700 family)